MSKTCHQVTTQKNPIGSRSDFTTSTRRHQFCAAKGRGPLPPENEEPVRVTVSICLMEMGCFVITSVTRDALFNRKAALWHRPDFCVVPKNMNIKIKKNDYANHKTLGGKASGRPRDGS